MDVLYLGFLLLYLKYVIGIKLKVRKIIIVNVYIFFNGYFSLVNFFKVVGICVLLLVFIMFF